MMNDIQFPWFILVPEISGLTELFQLNQQNRHLFLAESCYLTECLQQLFQADKMNIGSLGNIVKQLHIHHIVRYKTDRAWPGPVWGNSKTVPYSNQQRTDTVKLLKSTLLECTFLTT
jgi:diadenosine tetraphosphate (Ap4A) HIT family hydrolase